MEDETSGIKGESESMEKCHSKPLLHLVFIYGTLKKSQRNNFRLRSLDFGVAKFVGTARTVVPFPLVIYTRWNLPFLLHDPGKGQKVFGEIYAVDDQRLKWFDAFEDHPEIYERDKVTCQIVSHDVTESVKNDVRDSSLPSDVTYDSRFDLGRDTVGVENGSSIDDRILGDSIGGYEVGQEVNCWTYFLKDFLPEMADLETYSSYDSNGSHNKACTLRNFVSVEDSYGCLVGRKRTSRPFPSQGDPSTINAQADLTP